MTRELPAYRWLGHATVFVPGTPSVAVDPWRWRLGAEADVVLVTSAHVDHCSEDDIAAARRGDAAVIAPRSVAERLRATFGASVDVIEEGQTIEERGVCVRALPAEGPIRDGVRSGFLPRGSGLAYLVELGGVQLLFLGDSRVLSDHEGLRPDVAFLGVGGLVTNTPEEAADDAERLGAGVVVPVHWGDLEARHSAATRFVELCAARGLSATVPTGGNAPEGSAGVSPSEG